MVDGRDELSSLEREPYFAALVENIELHMADIEVVGDEIRKVQELISETMHDDGQKWKTKNLGEATERLEKRVRKWILQLSDQFMVVRSEILRLQRGEIGETVKGESYHSQAVSESLAQSRGGKEPGLERRVLTDREKEVLKLVAGGKSSRSIAEELHISVHTVNRHRANMMGKLNLRKATDLVKYAISQGILVPDGGSLKDE